MEYELREIKKENIETYAKLLSDVFKGSDKFTPEFLDWQYFQNPLGNVVGYDAIYNNEIVAHYATIPVSYMFNNRPTKGLLSLNTATHSNHQGKGLFTKLANNTYYLAKESGYDFVIGVANQNSTHGFIKKLGFYLIGQLDVILYVGQVKKKSDLQNYFVSCWDEKTLAWRLKNPSANYLEKEGSIFSNTAIPFIKSLLLTEKKSANVDLKKAKIIPIKMAIGFNVNRPLFSINLPDKLKPSPLNLIFKNLSDFTISVSKDNCYFELIDFDAY